MEFAGNKLFFRKQPYFIKMSNILTRLMLYIQFFGLPVLLFSQTTGTRISVIGTDGKTYTGVVQEVTGNLYKIKYDGYNYTATVSKNQLTIIDGNTGTTANSIAAGTKVNILGTNGKIYTAVIKGFNGNKYRVQYDGYNNEEWLVRTQFTVGNSSVNTTLPTRQITTAAAQTNIIQDVNGLKAIFEFGRQKGWVQQPHVNKFNVFLKILSADDSKKVVVFLQQATTPSARFFALKSLLTGDSYPVVQKFIEELNQHPESYQQENCLVTNRRSIIQQWEFSCSVTVVQTFLADLSPRYAWEVKQIPNFDAAANNPNHPMAEQQKQLLEKYGGIASPRGDYSGKAIGINDALNELVGPIVGARYYAQQVNEPLQSVLTKIRSQVDRGFDVPLLVGFVGSQARHFILTMRYRKTAGGYQYLIYDPWDGVCDYVDEATILQGSLSPLLTQWKISIEYYYPVQ
jgi:hypothetical protein